MFGRLRQLFDPLRAAPGATSPGAVEAGRRAIAHVRRAHPGHVVVGDALLRGNEDDRYVFAVFYRVEPDAPAVGPAPGVPPHRIVAVPKGGGDVEELALTPRCPYRIRGVK